MRVAVTSGWVDLEQGLVVRQGITTTLTQTERKLLAFLVTRPDAVVDRGDLLREVWGYSAGARTRTIDVTMRRLREKVEVDPSEPDHFVTVVGRGYRFVPLQTAHGLLGRDADLAQLARCVEAGTTRMLLTGPGGVGKTSLARAWASSQSGAVTVELSGMRTAMRAVEAIRDGMGLGGEAVVDAVLRQALAARTHALVLDNVDDLDADARACIREMVGLFGGVVVGTCRRIGQFDGEHVVEVSVLPVHVAMELMRERLDAAGVSGSDEAVRDLVRVTDGLPLAIEMAAVRARSLGVQNLVQYLPDTSLLVDAARTGSHRSLAALMESSWEPLSAELRLSLKALAMLSGPFTMARAEVVLGRVVAEHLAQLCECSLVQREKGIYPETFRLLDTVRSFVRSRVSEDEQVQFDERWAAFADLRSGDVHYEEPGFLRLLAESRHEIVDAFERRMGARSRLAILAYGALYFVDRLSTLREVLDAAVQEEHGELRQELLVIRGWTHRRLGALELSVADAQSALECPRSTESMCHEARLLIGQCRVYTDPERAVVILGALADEPTTSFQIKGMAYTCLGHGFRRLGKPLDARTAYERGTVMLTELRPRLRCAPLVGLGNLALNQGDLSSAADWYDQANECAAQAKDAHTKAVLAASQGLILLAQHQWDDAALVMDRAAVQHGFLGRARSRLMALFNCGRAHWHAGRVDKAHEVVSLSLALAERDGHKTEAVWIGLVLSMIESARGRVAQARRLVEGRGNEEGLTQLAQGAIAAAEGDYDRACELAEAATSRVSKELEPELTHLLERVERRAPAL